MEDNEQPKLSISQEAFDRYLVTHSAPELLGKEWTLDVEWNPAPPKPDRRAVTSVTYNGVDLTEYFRGASVEIPLMPSPAPNALGNGEVSFTVPIEISKFDAVRLMRVFGASRRIWTTRKHKRPRGRIVVK